jgi:hypothetical protein
MPNQKLLTIDTDNAIIRFRVGDARALGMPEACVTQLRADVEALGTAISAASGTTFAVDWVPSPEDIAEEVAAMDPDGSLMTEFLKTVGHEPR